MYTYKIIKYKLQYTVFNVKKTIIDLLFILCYYSLTILLQCEIVISL